MNAGAKRSETTGQPVRRFPFTATGIVLLMAADDKATCQYAIAARMEALAATSFLTDLVAGRGVCCRETFGFGITRSGQVSIDSMRCVQHRRLRWVLLNAILASAYCSIP
jgi:hypothetical protein